MADGAHHSIGEVLSLLKEEHADVTISKIRFLESQGLIEPERTPSGYRKFYDSDIQRLRWILAQQRDNFLPLKVIKRRLEEAGFDPAAELESGGSGPLPEPTLFARRGDDGPTVDLRDPVVIAEEPDQVAAVVETPAAPPLASSAVDRAPLAVPAGSVSMTIGELADSVDCDIGFVGELQKLGLIEAITTDDGEAFDHEALVVARAAVELRTRGFEPRNLRMFKVAADREAGVFRQIVAPMLMKGSDAHVRASTELNELVRLSETIRRSILRRSLGAPPDR